MRFWLVILALALYAFGGTLKDTPSSFVYQDSVRATSTEACESGERLIPERVSYREGSMMPYRVYPVALPSSAKPSVSVTDLASTALKAYCSEDTLVFSSTIVEKPYQREGMWMTTVWVPLLKGSKAAPSLRQSFKLTVNMTGTAPGKNPGKRALGRVLNKKSAAKFGNKVSTSALRRSAVSDISSAEWLARFIVGDKENGGHSEDGLYGVSFKEVKTAMQKVSRSSDLDGIKVANLRLYGAPADTAKDVPGSASEMLPNKLQEVPMDVVDNNSNGIFDDGDSLYFVGYGTSVWKRNDLEDSTYASDPMAYFHSSSPYSFYQYFQLAVNTSGTPVRLSDSLSAPSASGSTLSPLRYVRSERDLLLRDTYFGKEDGTWESASGKEWFWVWNSPNSTTSISSSTLNYGGTSDLPGRVSGGKGYIAVTFFPRRSTGQSYVDDNTTQTKNFNTSSWSYEKRMQDITFSASVNGTAVSDFALSAGNGFTAEVTNLKDSGNTYAITILPGGLHFDRFDGYSVAYEWEPETDSADWIFPGTKTGVIKMAVPSGLSLMKFSEGYPEGLLKVSGGYAKDSITLAEDARYMLYDPTRVLSPTIEGVPNRSSGVLERPEKISSKTEYIIIAPEDFEAEALELANFRAGSSSAFPIVTTLVLAEDIYKLYTGGSLSPIAIRDYLAYAYSVCPNLQYVLLAGSTHFDYRLKNSSLPEIRVPTFEKEDAVIEDFFGVLDSGEAVRFGSYDLDLSVGRIPVQSTSDFDAYLDKVYLHEKKASMDNGNWRNTLIFTADDAKNGTSDDTQQHTGQAERLSNMIDSIGLSKGYRYYNTKIYLLDYEEDASGQKPEAATDLQDGINKGALFTIYFGHGSITDWASEGLLKPSYISLLSNEGLYTILASFSCSLGRFDKGTETSLSEQFVTTSSRGSIASLGASRESYSTQNETFAKSFFSYALGDTAVRLGDAFRLGKGTSAGTSVSQQYNNERYALLGEPVISMPYEKRSITFDTEVDTIQALDYMTVSGSVDGISSGKLYLSVREGEQTKTLTYEPASDDTVNVSYEGSLIYTATVDISNGKFSTDFITPRKISFGDTAAEITAYAYASGDPYIGRYLKSGIAIYGTSSYADSLHDTTPPTIGISTCASTNETYIAEGQTITLESPACLQVTVEDSTALDFTEEADEGVTFEVTGVTSAFHPWPYLEQTSKKVVVRMSFSENTYGTGTYEFKVRAQDILGNVATKAINVEITDKLTDGLADVFNAPNPMGKNGTTFYFKDLAVGYSATVTIFIYNQNGRMVQRLTNAKSGETHWDGRDFYGRKLANGLYHYVVKSVVPKTDTSSKKTFVKKQKLVISR